MVEGWKGPLGVIRSNSMLKQGYLEHIAQDHVQEAFDDLQGERLHHLSGQSVPVLSYLHSTKVLPGAQREPLVCRFVPTGYH